MEVRRTLQANVQRNTDPVWIWQIGKLLVETERMSKKWLASKQNHIGTQTCQFSAGFFPSPTAPPGFWRTCRGEWGKGFGDVMLFLLLQFHISDIMFLFQYLDSLVEMLQYVNPLGLISFRQCLLGQGGGALHSFICLWNKYWLYSYNAQTCKKLKMLTVVSLMAVKLHMIF